MDDIDWNEELAEFDANAALNETRIMWLRLARQFQDIVMGSHDFLESPKSADEAMAWVARSEACFWRATGDAETIDADQFIPELRARLPQAALDALGGG